MSVGVPREVKDGENRIGLTPESVETLVQDGNDVLVEEGAGEGIGRDDAAYRDAGASIVDASMAWDADLVVKVKEPLQEEYAYLDGETTLFTYLHLAADRPLTEELLDSGTTSIAYETVEEDGTLPLLRPMSEVAGRMAPLMGATYLQEHHGGKGVLPPGIEGADPAHYTVIGGGTVGGNAAEVAAGMGADVTVLDVDQDTIDDLNAALPDNATARYNTDEAYEEALAETDVLIGAVLEPGAKAPELVSEGDVKGLEDGSVIVDVAVDQGGCVATTEETSHADPVTPVHGVLHYAVPNMPGAYARTATYGLNDATLPYVRALADRGWEDAVRDDERLKQGVQTVDGGLVYEPVADAFGMSYEDIDDVV